MDVLALLGLLLYETVNNEPLSEAKVIVADQHKIVYVNIENVTINAGEQIETVVQDVKEE